MKKQLALLVLFVVGACDAPVAALHLRGVAEPGINCSLDDDSAILAGGLLDLRSGEGYFGFLRIEEENLAPGESTFLTTAEIYFALPDTFAADVPRSGDSARSFTITGSTHGPPRGFALAQLVTPDEAERLIGDTGAAALLADESARERVEIRVSVRAGVASPPDTSDDRLPPSPRDTRLVSNELRFPLELCVGCINAPCDEVAEVCPASSDQPICVPR